MSKKGKKSVSKMTVKKKWILKIKIVI